MSARRRAVIFDRDGVLNVDTGYIGEPERIEWVAGAMEAISLCIAEGFLVLVVTNQSGVGRGYFDESAVQQLHRWMAGEIEKHGTSVAAFYYCPHHPEAGCPCRKPKPGLFLQAIEEWELDPAQSFSVGDRESDVAASVAAGVPGYRFDGGNLAEFVTGLLQSRNQQWDK